jgi:hypothetical protein
LDTDVTARGGQLGAYGIRLRGVDAAADLLCPVGSDAPAYTLSTELGNGHGDHEYLSGDRAELRLQSGGRIHIDRDAGTVRFRVPHAVRPDELVHPYLAPAAAVIGRWGGKETMHAGAFAAGGSVWALVGDRGAGKSSTLAWMARNGFEVLCDDMIVLDGAVPHVGPRTVDLREDAAAQLDAGEPIGVTGARERWRLRLAPVAEGRPLAGWIFLAWGPAVAARRLGGAERLQRIAAQRGLRLPPANPEVLLELSALPAWELARPQTWSSLPATAEALLELAA